LDGGIATLQLANHLIEDGKIEMANNALSHLNIDAIIE